MSMARQAMRCRKARRPRPDDRNLFAGRLGALIELLSLLHRHIGGVALQTADLHRLAFRRLAHAGLLAQRLGRADAGAHAAEDILVEDGLGGAERIAGGDLADEQRNVDRRRTGVHARRVVTEIAAIGLDQRLVMVQRRMQVGKVLGILLGGQPAAGDAFLEETECHRVPAL